MILVTGATGFLGSAITKFLLDNGELVCALKRKNSVMPAILLPYDRHRLIWREIDVTDYYEVEDVLEGITQVYHCSALISFEPADRQRIMRVNVGGTRNVVNACLFHGIAKLVYVSSIATLGKTLNGDLITENTFWEYDGKQSDYAISKYESEMEVWRGIAEGLHAVIINPAIILGNQQFVQKEQLNLIRFLSRNSKYYPQGGTGFVEVTDVANCAIGLMNSNILGERFIVCAENFTFKDFLTVFTNLQRKPPPAVLLKKWQLTCCWYFNKFLNRLFGVPIQLNRTFVRSISETHFYANEKMRNALNYQFKSITDSLKSMVVNNG